MNQTETVMRHYENGREIFTIARKTGLSEKEVIRTIHQFMRENSTVEDVISPKQINETFANMIRNRYINEIDQPQIAKELDIPIYPIRVICNKANEHLGSKASFEEKYVLLDDITDLTVCPNCNNEFVHKYITYVEREVAESVEGLYCRQCENEYFKIVEKIKKEKEDTDDILEENESDKEEFDEIIKVYKINFEYID